MFNIAAIFTSPSINSIFYLILLIGLLFQFLPNNKIFHYLKLFSFLGLTFGIKNNLSLDQLQSSILIGIGASFSLGSFLLKNESLKNLSFLKFLYFGLAFLFILTKRPLDIFIILEILALIGFIFIITENYEKSKNIALRYLITHFFAGIILLCGLAFDNYDLVLLAKPFLLLALLINCAILPFSFWLVQAYSQVNFALAVIMMGVITKLSLYLLFKIFAGEVFLLYLGLGTILYGGLLLINEMNIKKFFCHSIVIHNGFGLIAISLLTKSDITQFSQLIFALFFSQILFCGLISVITKNQNSFYFIDLEKDLKQNKLLFILSLIINYIFIGMPFSPIFIAKSQIFSSLTTNYQNLIYVANIMIISAHFYIFHYKIFVRKNITTKNSLQSLKDNIFLLFLLILFLYINWNLPKIWDINNKKYFEFIIASGIIFIIFHKFFYKNHSNLLDFDFLILLLKKQFNIFFIRYRIFQRNCANLHIQLIDKINAKLTNKSTHKYSINSYNIIFIILIITSSLLIMIY